jgi:hypothetical protein
MRVLRRLALFLLKQSRAVGEAKIDLVVVVNLVTCRANLHPVLRLAALFAEKLRFSVISLEFCAAMPPAAKPRLFLSAFGKAKLFRK